ncbi:hypothetical protein LTR36_009520 [Oleoguttula mirabilis]|uniref:Peptide hydrolase n=1 Tax=Oleoguttula mirabilis TaxID=1507867 RepID=A0AAV9JU93_9PEZI|nr:hypothetical protein LTR36_009520 [Oleoguttula mirabilis]
MAKRSSWNPIAFVPAQVSIIASAIYIALFAILLWAHFIVPTAPSTPTPVDGVNLTQAWLDLDFISNGFHPYDSKFNDVVRGYLVQRIEEILQHNEAEYKVVGKPGHSNKTASSARKSSSPKPVTVFTYDPSNVTFVDDGKQSLWTGYTESQNILVYIRGTEDEEGDWWSEGKKYEGRHGGVLVNAHYDSVSSGYGATDDGMGVVSVLQLISHFTTEGHQPEHGIVALLNNGEENGLYGAHTYLRHPLSQFAHTFLNLEGAGAGGRATLFRSTDAEVTKFYAKSPNPFGSVTSLDGFRRGFVRSGTDYSIFTKDLGMRGLDVAFFEPRARYHTGQDDSRDASRDSLWHMLSASLATMEGLTSYSGNEFDGSPVQSGRLDLKSGSNGVWWDMFGQTFAVMKLPTLFALSVTLLAAGPILLIVLEVIIARSGKWFLFSRKQYLHGSDDDEPVALSGFRGFFRFPIAFIVATAAVVALAYLLAKLNPMIAYGSEYAVWAMMLSAWFSVAWFILAGADRVRPTALQNMFCLIWLYACSWCALVIATVGENNFQLASGYFVVIYNAAVFVALLISYLELFGLPTKAKYVEHVAGITDHDGASIRPGSRSSRTLLSESGERAAASVHTTGEDEEATATESTSLLRGRAGPNRGTFTGLGKRRQPEDDGTLDTSDDPFLTKAYGDEQAWSSSLPQWTWILQFLILAPINIVIVGQIALLITSALHQTPADGNAVLPIYVIVAGLSVLLLLPLTPFIHRFSYHIPTVLFLVFIACLIYNLLAFPFSREARLKHYFVQQIDLDTGANNVSLTGVDGYLQEIVAQLPSASGVHLNCEDTPLAARNGLQSCSWPGLAPNVVPVDHSVGPYSNTTTKKYQTWLDYNVTFHKQSASFTFRGRNTKSYRLLFDNPIAEVQVEDGATDPRYKTVSEKGSSQVRLYSRTWDKTFRVNVTWSEDAGPAKGQTGKVVSLWSDANQLGTIPAFDEVRRFEPTWSAVTKAGDGLVEGWKAFELR